MCDPTMFIGPAIGLAGSLFSSNAAAQAQQEQQQAQDYNEAATAIDNTLAAEASNRVLEAFLQQQGVNQATNTAALQPVYNAIQPGVFNANQAQIAGNNATQANNAITALLNSSGPQLGLTNTDNGQSARAINDRTAARVGVARQTADNAAALQAYGQNFADLGQTETTANRNIDTTNEQARAQAQILRTDEQNAALQARHFFPPAQADTSGATMQQGIGNAIAGIGGALSGPAMQGLQNGLGGVFNYMNPTIPTTGPGSGFNYVPAQGFNISDADFQAGY